MRIIEILKKIGHAIVATAIFILPEALGEIEYRKMYGISCPLDKNETSKGYGLIGTKYLNSLGLYKGNDTAIIGNTEWKVNAYEYSLDAHSHYFREGYNYPVSSFSCIYLAKKRVAPYDFPKYIYVPHQYECFYKFYEDPYKKVQGGIDLFGLITNIASYTIPSEFNTYSEIVGQSAYSTDQVYCGGVRKLGYLQRALRCPKDYAVFSCDLLSEKPAIPTEKLNATEEELMTCKIEESKQVVKEEEPEDECQINKNILSTMFHPKINVSVECNCNCGGDSINSGAGLFVTKNKTKHKSNPHKRKQCTIL